MAFKMSPKGSVAKKACSPLKMGIKTTKTTAPKSIKVSEVKKSPVKKYHKSPAKKYHKSPMKMDESYAKAKNLQKKKLNAAGFKGDVSKLTSGQQVALQKLGGQAMKGGLNMTYINKKRNEILGKGKKGGEASPNKFLGKLARKVGKKVKGGKAAQAVRKAGKTRVGKALKTAGKVATAGGALAGARTVGRMIKNKRAGKPALQGGLGAKLFRKVSPTKKRNCKK